MALKASARRTCYTVAIHIRVMVRET